MKIKLLILIAFFIIPFMAMSQNSITTTFAGGNGHDGNMLDITAIGASDVTIDSLDFHLDPGDAYILVYYKAGTYVGSEANASAWIKHDSIHVVSAGVGNPTRVHIGGLLIPHGQTYGLYLTCHSAGIDVNYTDGANTYSDANVSITTGIGLAYPFGTSFSPRTWNGTIYYSLNDCTTPMIDPNSSFVCQGTDVVSYASSGIYNWYEDSSTDTLYEDSGLLSSPAAGVYTLYSDAFCPNSDTVMMDVATQESAYSPDVRGFYFVAPCDFVITGLRVPTDNAGNQTIQVVRFTLGAPPSYASTTNDFVSLGYWNNIPGTDIIPANFIIHTGDIIGIVGVRGNTTSYHTAPYTSSINGFPVTLNRLGMQFDLSTQQLHDVWTESGGNIGRVEMYYQGGYASNPTDAIFSVTSSYQVTNNISVCDGDSVFAEGIWQTTTGLYTDTYTSMGGCDSIIETNLTVNPILVNQYITTLCQGDSIFAEGAWQTTTGLYYDTLTSVQYSCDSIIETDLTVNPTLVNQYITTLCQGDSIFAEGAWQTATGLYYDTLTSVQYSCDSIIETDLTVHLNPVVNLGIDSLICDNESILLDAGSFNSYLWSDGTILQTLLVDTNNFNIGANEIFVEVLDANGCLGSDTVFITIDECTGLDGIQSMLIRIFPNPVSDLLTIEFSNAINGTEITVLSSEGKILFSREVDNTSMNFDFSDLANGMYLVKIKSDNQYKYYKVIKE